MSKSVMTGFRSRNRKRVLAGVEGESRTKQSFKEECDINNILKRYQRDGLLSHVNKYQGVYSDLGTVEEYHSSMNQVIAAQAAFDSLPSSIRLRFANDPAKFLAFVDDPRNGKELVEMGLATARPVPESSASQRAQYAGGEDDDDEPGTPLPPRRKSTIPERSKREGKPATPPFEEV